jgi:hypothetical protein
MKLEAGITLNSWTLLKPDSTRRYYWLCRCACGRERSIRAGSLTDKKKPSRSCGKCTRTQDLRTLGRTHGMSRTPTYKAWERMLRRTRHDPEYLRKGITACPRWLDFRNFFDDMGHKPEGRLVSLHRVDNDGDYCPENCKWSEPKEQNANKGNSVFITSEQFGIKPQSEWVAILSERTGEPWTARRLKSALAGVATIDRLLKAYEITSFAECAADPWAVNSDEFVPA